MSSMTRPKSASRVTPNAKQGSNSKQGSPSISVNMDSSEISAANILESKNNRKRAEADLQLLSNRISLLKLEEQKSLQKVQETKTRAKEILDIKKRNESAVQSRIMQNVEREMEVKEYQSKVAAARENRRAKLQATKDQVLEAKRQAAERLRREQKLNESTADSSKVEAEQLNRSKAYEERRRKEQLRMRAEEERRAKERALQEEAQKKIEYEEKKRLEAERVIAMLEAEEKQLIARLKKTQEMQEQAIATLQSSLEA